MPHLLAFSLIVPLFSAIVMLLLREKRHRAQWAVAFTSVLLQMGIGVALMLLTAGMIEHDQPYHMLIYLLGNWEAPYGIVLIADQLAALMLTLTALLGLCSLLYANAFWDKAGVHFYPIFQMMLMGLNGAFLTGDLFNLFVFFEIFLAASYALLLHGSGEQRVTSGFHYIIVNLIGAFLMLIGISMIYSVTGTLNLAELGAKAGVLNSDERRLFEVACSLLATAFLIKAAAWPLSFWLKNAYAAATPPVAAMFSILTKVGVYALLRVGSLLLPTGAPAGFGGEWMFIIGIGTLFYGCMGLLAEQHLARMIAFCIVISSGTLLTALGMPGVTLTGPSLYYLISSVLSLGAAYLLVEIIQRTESVQHSVLMVSLEAFGLDQDKSSDYVDNAPSPQRRPWSLSFLGIAFFICALIIAGLPPFSGFIAKFALLSQAIELAQYHSDGMSAWVLVGFMLFSGVITVIVLGRSGIRIFWGSGTLQRPNMHWQEALPIALLLASCIGITVFATDMINYMERTALSLDDPSQYIEAVFQQRAKGG